MAGENVQSTEKAALSPVDESSCDCEELLRRLEKVSDEINEAIDSNLFGTHEKEDLKKLYDVLLNEIKGRLITPQDHGDSGKKDEEKRLLPQAQSKREELSILLKEINDTLQKRKQPRRRPEPERPALQKKLLLAATGCNPLNKLMRPQEKRQQGGGGEEEDEDEAEEVSLMLLVRLAQHVLEPEQYYEWTTSYVDESRIYGWDKEADEVMEALIGPDDGDFRAAAITGIHGSGKTALAQKVFVHDKAKDHFPIRLWVCVGPPDSEDRFNLLYRMLDNLGLDTIRVEDVIVDEAAVVKRARETEEKKIPREEIGRMWEAAYAIAKKKRKDEEDKVGGKKIANEEDANINKEDPMIKEEFDKLLKHKTDSSLHVQNSKIGVLLYILHVTLSKTAYLIVFDDIRVYGDDGWYNNLTLPPPPDGEWSDRLAYGLPKTAKHRNAVLVTCRKEDDARTMVRTGRVFHPPQLEVDHGWMLFDREYKQAKELKKDAGAKEKEKKVEGEEDLLLKELEKMKQEIVDKCLRLPVAIIEAAKGFADLEPLPEPKEDAAKPAEDKQIGSSNKDMQTQGATEAAADKPEPELVNPST